MSGHLLGPGDSRGVVTTDGYLDVTKVGDDLLQCKELQNDSRHLQIGVSKHSVWIVV
jgi:hypothetical protein